jgi:hypothetical protein
MVNAHRSLTLFRMARHWALLAQANCNLTPHKEA